MVNADQTVLIIWDAAAKMQHFVRRASFKSEARDFGFLIPTPSAPELAEAGDGAFPMLTKLTAPAVLRRPGPLGSGCDCACGRGMKSTDGAAQASASVTVLQEKTVAGFDAVVLEASSAEALVGWLKTRGYAFSDEVQAWAKPYVEGGWKITALRVAKAKSDDAGVPGQAVTAGSLRMSFKTERPLFPYREPESTKSAAELGASSRLLRIFFLADGRYDGELTKDVAWMGKVAWAKPLAAVERQKLTDLVGVPALDSEVAWWLTEFEDPWPYKAAPSDLYFSRTGAQDQVEREPIILVGARDATSSVTRALAAAALLPFARRLMRPRA